MRRIQTLVTALAACAALLAPSPDAGAKPRKRRSAPGSAVAELEWEAGLIAWPQGHRAVPLSKERPERLQVPPGLREPRFAQLGRGVLRGLTVVLDLTPGTERIWVDTDRDGDLAEHRAVRWTLATPWRAYESVELALGKAPEPVSVDLEFRFQRSEGGERLTVRSLAHRRGRVVLAGRVRQLAVVDANANLRFDDEGEDYLYLDVDGDGALREGRGSYEAFPVGTPIRLGADGWVAAIPDEVATTVEFLRMSSPPAARPRRWVPEPEGETELGATPPAESFAALKARYERELLRAPDAAAGTLALIGSTGTEEAFEFLLKVIESEGPVDVRAAAVEALGQRRFVVDAGPVLAAIAPDGDSDFGAAAVRALHRMRHPQRERIYRDVLESGSRAARCEVGAHIGYVRTASARELVLYLLAKDPDEAVRRKAYVGARATALGPPRTAMLEMLRGEDDEVAALALRDLHAVGDRSIRPLALEAIESVREAPGKRRRLGLAAVDILASIVDRQIVEALRPLAKEEVLGDRIAQHLGDVRSQYEVDMLLSYLQSRVPAERAFGARVLGHVRQPRVTDRLLDVVGQETENEPLEAMLVAIGEHGSKRATDALLKLARDADPDVRPSVMRALASVGMDTPAVRRHFLRLLEARSWEERVLALEACTAAGDPSYAPAAVKSLTHPRWQVRLAAAQALDTLGVPESVDELITALEKEEHQRNREALRKALQHITGVNYYDDAGLWRKWYETVGKAAPSGPGRKAPGYAGKTTEAPPGKFYGILVRSHHVAFVLDRSGSMDWPDPTDEGGPDGMSRSKMEVAVEQLLGAVARIPDSGKVNVVLFGNSVSSWGSRLRKLSHGNRRALATFLRAQDPNGATNLYDALERAMDDPEADTVYLLSDGAANVGKHTEPSRIARDIHCVAARRHSSLLMRLARENGGDYVRH
jgi:HEAT repeat protein